MRLSKSLKEYRGNAPDDDSKRSHTIGPVRPELEPIDRDEVAAKKRVQGSDGKAGRKPVRARQEMVKALMRRHGFGVREDEH